MTTFTNHLKSAVSSLKRGQRLALVAVVSTSLAVGISTVSPLANAATKTSTGITVDGIPNVKHVWYIIMENKSFDATFTGLNNNTYLWKTLPSEGTLLTNYYGTGHYSQDNYSALVSGQAPLYDHQLDSPMYKDCLLYTSPSPRDGLLSRMPSSA